MAIFKCKMCGDNIEVSANMTYGTCESCGSTMTFPKIDDDQKANLYNRANFFRRQNEFDKALGIYEKIIDQDNNESEAHWGAVLCRFGIEYVEDPSTHERVPTCHRASFDSILKDVDYLEVLKCSTDVIAKGLYEKEATYIAEIQKEIITISQKEKPYDVFICYKETDEMGARTKDSALAQDVYYQLTNEGYKVFFSRITLEDKLGQAYEPYIFAALNSAKVMVVIGTQSEYYNAVWVKNEWSRYLNLIKKDKTRLLIPCYRDMDAYELPEELSMLQSQDMGKIGFVQDLIRGVRKVIVSEKEEKTVIIQQTDSATNLSIQSYLNRIELFLEDCEWSSAQEYCEKVLDLDVKCAMAYAFLLCVSLKCTSISTLSKQDNRLNDDKNYQKVLRFGDENLKGILEKQDEIIADRLEENRKNMIYRKAMNDKKANNFDDAIKGFSLILEYKDSEARVTECIRLKKIEESEQRKKAAIDKKLEEEQKRKKKKVAYCILSLIAICVIVYIFVLTPMFTYNKASDLFEQGAFEEASQVFIELGEYKDSKNMALEAENQHLQVWIKQSAETVSTGWSSTVGLKSDGTVVATGDNDYGKCDVSSWTDIVAVSAGEGGNHTVGLKSDGTVVATGDNTDGQCDVSSWTDIVAVSAGGNHTVGLKSDGTVVATGYDEYDQSDVLSWTDIVAVSAGSWHTVGLKSDGTVVVAGENVYGYPYGGDWSWSDIVAVSAGGCHIVGLKSDGTVVAMCDGEFGEDCEYDVLSWENIVAVSAHKEHTVGLKSDGTVVATGDNTHGQCDVSSWTDIVAVSAGRYHTVGLKSDGTVVATGNNEYDQCDVLDWSDIMVYDK